MDIVRYVRSGDHQFRVWVKNAHRIREIVVTDLPGRSGYHPAFYEMLEQA